MVSQVFLSTVCWRQLLQFSPPCNMWWSFKMFVSVALCLVFFVTLSEAFFLPASLRKQPDCARRAPQTTSFNSQHWIPTQTSGGTANGVGQNGYGNLKDINPYQQQQQQIQQQQQQQQQVYGSQHSNQGPNGPQKYEPTPYQTVAQPQYAYDAGYQSSLNSYPQSVQLVPCLCPVSKDVIEQQSQQLHAQTPLPASPPTPPSFPSDAVAAANLAATPPGNQKKNS